MSARSLEVMSDSVEENLEGRTIGWPSDVECVAKGQTTSEEEFEWNDP